MSSKQSGRGGAAAAKSKKTAKAGTEEKREDTLQAVVLADSFQDRFKPFTLEKPRCLLPLAGVPIIEYTLEFLALNGVQQVFIYCGAHSEEIEKYIHDSKRWSPRSVISPFSSLEFIRVSDANSVGDFLRDLDKRSLIEGDFILVHGDLVANIELDEALAKHRARREANRDACMTMVLRSIGDEPHRAKQSRVITPVFAIEQGGRCWQYEEMHPLMKEHKLVYDPSVIELPDWELRSDLIDCGIDICTPEVLALWSESFDYELPRENFLHGVLKDHELNGKMIYTEVLESGYAARANSLPMYDCISRDILGRYTLPFVPDTNLVHDQTFKRIKEGSCFENNVIIARGATVTTSVIGKNSKVDEGAIISRSIIGRRCKIGKNVKIVDSYIWDDTTIGDNTEVTRAVIADRAVIGQGCKIPEGALISYGVLLSDKTQLPPNPIPRISLLTYDKSLATTDASLVGEGGKGALFTEEQDDEEDSDDEVDRDPGSLEKTLFYSHEELSHSISTLASHADYESDADDSFGSFGADDDSHVARHRLSSFTSDDSGLSPDAFHNDAVHGLLDALRAGDNEDFDSAKLEFMGLRLANNASDSSMRRSIAVAFARRAAELMSSEHGGLEATKAAEKAFNAKKGAIKFIREVGVGGDEAKVQAEFALALQKALLGVKGLEAARAGTLLAAMLQQLYSSDVLEEDGILLWWGDARAGESESLAKLKEKCRVLVEWLENADEEESDEEDEEDSD
ncbi:nucleotide-diphospho-sugar transferase [Podospora aff. communis PSN243]|uniref:Mannose-1-phosphate guanyltransferase n=1 Tax=Podospora aff. communis PSN243 TaxID=3040156 RepID=A0AAV9GWI8_9PEZI|nr:nucleotide-diphospho-sugar transferase [Podospora aff. communis PSN243]